MFVMLKNGSATQQGEHAKGFKKKTNPQENFENKNENPFRTYKLNITHFKCSHKYVKNIALHFQLDCNTYEVY